MNFNVDNSKTVIVEKVVQKVVVTPTEGDISPAHKQRLKELVQAIVDNTGDGYGAVWSKLQRKFRVNTYHALSEDQYPKVLTWLKQWYAGTKGK